MKVWIEVDLGIKEFKIFFEDFEDSIVSGLALIFSTTAPQVGTGIFKASTQPPFFFSSEGYYLFTSISSFCL